MKVEPHAIPVQVRRISKQYREYFPSRIGRSFQALHGPGLVDRNKLLYV